MPSKLFRPGSALDLFAQFESEVHQSGPTAIGVASAFVSTYGAKRLVALWESVGRPPCHAIFGIDHAVTHPGAIGLAIEAGILVRVGKAPTGIFHPKLMIAGVGWADSGALPEPRFLYVGSANLTFRGMRQNTEIGFIATGGDVPPESGELFGNLWNEAAPATEEEIAAYAARFSKRNAERRPVDLDQLEISEDVSAEGLTQGDMAALPEPDEPVQNPAYATGAWAGLESFTGEYALQVEFPRSAGEVLRNRVGENVTLNVLCADGSYRPMLLRYYEDNAMFRLNIPNETPDADWVREHQQGIAVVEIMNGQVSVRLLRPGFDADQIIAKSAALGSWGRTATRLYGWY
jgi:phospholipase D-like protein